MKNLFYGLCIITLLNACGSSGGGNAPAALADWSGFTSQSINGSSAKLATKKDADGNLLEQGVMEEGTKNGVYITYHPDNRIKTIGSYVNGRLNGVYLELTNRGQIEYKAHYLNDQFNGQVGRYKFGRASQELTYANGELEGPFIEYSDRGKVAKKGEFKNGKQHGKLQFFDDDENMIMEYEYENGEKVSGGIIEK